MKYQNSWVILFVMCFGKMMCSERTLKGQRVRRKSGKEDVCLSILVDPNKLPSYQTLSEQHSPVSEHNIRLRSFPPGQPPRGRRVARDPFCCGYRERKACLSGCCGGCSCGCVLGALLAALIGLGCKGSFFP